MTDSPSADVVIAGAGPTGLMLAAELALAGVHPVVLERRTEPGAEPRANGLGGQVVPLMDRRGLFAPLSGTPGPPEPNRVAFFFGGLPLDLSLLDESPMYTMAAPQAHIVAVLVEHATALGVEIRWGHELTGLSAHDDGVTVEVRGPDGPYRIESGYLVGAEGAHSVVRKRSGIGFPGLSLDRMTGYSAQVTLPEELVDPDTVSLRVPGFGEIRPFLPRRTPHGGVSFAPFPGRPVMLSTLEWDRPEPDGPVTLDEFRDSLRRVLGVDLPFGPPTGDGPHLLRRMEGGHIRVAERLRDGRVLLIGDAAHVYSGGGGPGLNLGLQDALNLGWKLAATVRGDAPEGLLDSYHDERSAAAHRTVTYSRAQAALLAPGDDVDGLHELFGELLTDPVTVARLAAMIAGSDVRYDPGDDAAHPRVGYLAPDRTVHTADGPVRLAELARSGRMLLVDPTPDGALAAVAPDGVQVVRGTLDGDGPAAVLVRPDGYLAWASDPVIPSAAEVDALRRATDRWCGAPVATG